MQAVTHIETELKLRSQAYNNVKQSLDALEKKQSYVLISAYFSFSSLRSFLPCRGSLLTRNLNDVLKKEHFILGSEYLKTLLVCVPRSLVNEWYAKYENLCTMIVPRSTELITQDQDYALFSVTLFQKTEDTFRHKCRENK